MERARPPTRAARPLLFLVHRSAKAWPRLPWSYQGWIDVCLPQRAAFHSARFARARSRSLPDGLRAIVRGFGVVKVKYGKQSHSGMRLEGARNGGGNHNEMESHIGGAAARAGVRAWRAGGNV